ncbi:hypothetical protein IscW_ISCW022885 [Ixodes scapularis]|uniref:Uncharacterized protein n=1 Tax=Ixodes scapularis TaxID=6945 RepID=B7QD58_IXOSC|nr:hypothetical protein IscW_ISCW022885 [Ixodes scapularis]|eukprot:XP_002413472.1 hypothetical protein IscW_ISCW022885 [Ixodes scapularis]
MRGGERCGKEAIGGTDRDSRRRCFQRRSPAGPMPAQMGGSNGGGPPSSTGHPFATATSEARRRRRRQFGTRAREPSGPGRAPGATSGTIEDRRRHRSA